MGTRSGDGMQVPDARIIADISPELAWRELASNPESALVDVRTRAEWSFVGCADLTETGRRQAFVEWRHFPQLDVNPRFVDDVADRFGSDWPDTLIFICRSGVRSREAAGVFSQAASDRGRMVRCLNLAGGFEGDLDEESRRGAVNGWKVKGLPWKQS
ncbi:MAG: rhodanese-like domain-containing protein [Rhodobacteraceae bacterium]|nr:rhodanese-like domain-containing protein [Paracoccaceae bacterium]